MQRRQFLLAASALPAFATAPSLSFANALLPAEASNLLVLVYLKGGNDGYNTFVPLKDAKYRRLRPTLAIAPEQTIPFSATHGFHPALRALLPAWQQNEMALLQGIGQQEITNQHYRDLETQFTGAALDEYHDEGWITRAFKANASLRSPTLDALAFGDLDIRVADPMGPFRGDQLRVLNMQHPAEWLTAAALEQTDYVASKPLGGGASLAIRPPLAALKTTFPANEFGDALKATVALAAANRAPRTVHITLNAVSGDQHDAFDTHWDQLKYHGNALSRLAEGLASFRAAMIEIGKWDSTLVTTYDEFGRCPKENDRGGTHHGWATTHIALGGKVKGGLLGEAPPLVDVFAIDGPPPVIDTRAFYTTVIERWWGGKASGIFAKRFQPLDFLRA